jgi:acyl-CoA synthetase (AMP-forming)/AMP-acid ligase II
VSTAEVALSLGHHPDIVEANVYGVTVPGHEGRAGCAAVVFENPNPNLADIVKYARSTLPRYAVPVFLRVVKRSSHIHNHKQNKVPLRKEGVDPDKVGTEEKAGGEDVFLWLKPGAETYEPFSRKDWQNLVGGKVRL